MASGRLGKPDLNGVPYSLKSTSIYWMMAKTPIFPFDVFGVMTGLPLRCMHGGPVLGTYRFGRWPSVSSRCLSGIVLSTSWTVPFTELIPDAT